MGAISNMCQHLASHLVRFKAPSKIAQMPKVQLLFLVCTLEYFHDRSCCCTWHTCTPHHTTFTPFPNPCALTFRSPQECAHVSLALACSDRDVAPWFELVLSDETGVLHPHVDSQRMLHPHLDFPISNDASLFSYTGPAHTGVWHTHPVGG